MILNLIICRKLEREKDFFLETLNVFKMKQGLSSRVLYTSRQSFLTSLIITNYSAPTRILRTVSLNSCSLGCPPKCVPSVHSRPCLSDKDAYYGKVAQYQCMHNAHTLALRSVGRYSSLPAVTERRKPHFTKLWESEASPSGKFTNVHALLQGQCFSQYLKVLINYEPK